MKYEYILTSKKTPRKENIKLEIDMKNNIILVG